MIQFPSNFFWGSATSSYQVEGNNSNTDWWVWEKKVGKEQSGDACRHFELYDQDFDLAKQLNHNAHRLSIEWARIEPQEGDFSHKALEHYIKVIQALRKRGIEPMVTLHHFTNPLWFSDMGGWESSKAADLFTRYCEFVVEGLAPHIQYWVTINEPTILSSHAFLFGAWPPQGKSLFRTLKVQEHQVTSHIKAYRSIHEVYTRKSLPKPDVGIAHHMPAVVTCNNTFRNGIAMKLRDWAFNFWFLDRIKNKGTLDFIGLNYYSRQQVDAKSWWITSLLGDVCQENHNPTKKNSLGWDIYPQGLYELLKKLKRYNLPVYITENGICTLNDEERWDFIVVHLKLVHQALNEGVDVRGYLYWSLLDNFEWDKGFGPRFGLIEVDYLSFKRTIKPSAIKFSEVCKKGILPD